MYHTEYKSELRKTKKIKVVLSMDRKYIWNFDDNEWEKIKIPEMFEFDINCEQINEVNFYPTYDCIKNHISKIQQIENELESDRLLIFQTYQAQICKLKMRYIVNQTVHLNEISI